MVLKHFTKEVDRISFQSRIITDYQDPNVIFEVMHSENHPLKIVVHYKLQKHHLKKAKYYTVQKRSKNSWFTLESSLDLSKREIIALTDSFGYFRLSEEKEISKNRIIPIKYKFKTRQYKNIIQVELDLPKSQYIEISVFSKAQDFLGYIFQGICLAGRRIQFEQKIQFGLLTPYFIYFESAENHSLLTLDKEY